MRFIGGSVIYFHPQLILSFIRMSGLDTLPVPLIAGVVAGIVALNIGLGFAWWYLRQRRAGFKYQTRHREKIPIPESPSSLAPPPPYENPPTFTAAPYTELVLNVQKARRESRRTSSQHAAVLTKRDHDHSSRLLTEERKGAKSKNTPSSNTAPVLSVPTPSTLPTTSGLKRGASVRSIDSASVYSVASASPTLHERLFRPWALQPIPASPALDAASFSPQPQRPPPARTRYAWPKRLSQIREPLAPETYAKVHWKTSDSP